MSQTASQHAAALTGKGNRQLCATIYLGAGGCGKNNQNPLTFPNKPFAVVPDLGNYVIPLFQGGTSTRDTGSPYLFDRHSIFTGPNLEEELLRGRIAVLLSATRIT